MSEQLPQITSGDATTSEQYRDTFHRSELLEPEKALLIALLEDGIHEYRKYYRARDRDGQQRFRKACEWFLADNEKWIFSFVNVCELLGLNPGYVRRRVIDSVNETLKEEQSRPRNEGRGRARESKTASIPWRTSHL